MKKTKKELSRIANKAWKTRRLCVICKAKPRMSEKAKTCSYSCAAKLAWQTMEGRHYGKKK